MTPPKRITGLTIKYKTKKILQKHIEEISQNLKPGKMFLDLIPKFMIHQSKTDKFDIIKIKNFSQESPNEKEEKTNYKLEDITFKL